MFAKPYGRFIPYFQPARFAVAGFLMSVFVLIANRLLLGLIVSHFHVAGRALMGQSTDPGIQHLKQTIALLRRFEEALLDVFSEEIAAARRSGDLASASQAEEFIRQLHVDLLEQRGTIHGNSRHLDVNRRATGPSIPACPVSDGP